MPIDSWRGKTKFIALVALTTLTIVYFVMTTPSFQAVYINSDQLTIISIADDLLQNPHFNPFFWNFSRAPYFFPDLTLTIVLRSLIHSDVVVAAVMLCLQSAAVAIAGAAMSASLAPSRRLRPNAVSLYGAIMLFALIGTRFGWYAGAVVWPFVSYSHAGALDFALIGFWLLARNLYAPPSRPIWIGVSILLTAAAYCSDKIAIVFFLPSAAIYVALRYKRSGVTKLMAFLLCQVLAISIMLYIDHIFYFQIMEHNEIKAIPNHLYFVFRFFQGQRIGFNLYYLILMSATAVVFVRSSVILLSDVSDSDHDRVSLQFLLSSSSLANALLMVWLWGTDDAAYTRYAVMLQFASPICVVSLLLLWLPSRTAKVEIGAPTFCLMLGLAALTWQGGRNPFEIVELQKQIGRSLRSCIAQNNLQSGYAAYWLARRMSSSTNWQVQIDQFAPAVPVPFFWGSNVTWFFNLLRDGNYNDHDFIILDDLAQDQVFARYGQPDEIQSCGGHVFAIYRTTDRLRNKVASQLTHILAVDSVREHLPQEIMAKLRDGGLAFGIDDLNSLVGHREPGLVSLSPEHGPGYGLFGPWLPLDAGSYHLSIAFTCLGDLTNSHFEIAAGELHQRVVGWLFADHPSVCDGHLQHAMLAFDAKMPLSMTEVRAYYGGQGNLSVTDVQLGRSADRS